MPPDHGPEPMLDPLSRLAIRFGTDKFGGHLYTPSYHQILRHWRDRPVRLLEIGVGGYEDPNCGGASLRMWAEYFPAGKIAGLDINPKSLNLPPRVTVVQGSQDDKPFLAALSAEHGPFDIVIDDGSHSPRHMIDSFWTLYPLLSAEGIYIIEDTQTCFIDRNGGNSTAQGTIYGLAHELVLQMHGAEGYVRPPPNANLETLAPITASVRFLRNIICFERGDNSYPSNHNLTLTDPAVCELLGIIERQAASERAPRSVLTRMDILYWAREFERTGELAMAAMRQYPDDLELLLELDFFMRRMPAPEISAALAARIAVLKDYMKG